jgi:hypothetical protein
MAAAPIFGWHDGSVPAREVALKISPCQLNSLVEIGLGWSATMLSVLATESNEVS